jgi:hypothetical protein
VKWRQLKFLLDSLSNEELDQEANAYDPFYQRVIGIVAFDHLTTLRELKQPKGPEPLAILLNKERK